MRQRELADEVSALQGQQLGVSVSGESKKDKGTLAAQLMEAQREASSADAEAKGLQIKASSWPRWSVIDVITFCSGKTPTSRNRREGKNLEAC